MCSCKIMYAIIIEEQAHFYDKVVCVVDTEEEGEPIIKEICEKLDKAGFNNYRPWIHMEKLPEKNESASKLALDFVRAGRYR